MKKLLYTTLAVAIFTGCNTKYQCINPQVAHNVIVCQDVKVLKD